MRQPNARQHSSSPPPENSGTDSSREPKPFWRRNRWGLLAAALLVGGYVFISYALGPLVAERLNRQITLESEGVYSLSVSAARVNLLQSRLIIQKACLKADSSRQASLQEAGAPPAPRFEAEVPLIKINIPFAQIFSEGPLYIRGIQVYHPEIRVTGRLGRSGETSVLDWITPDLTIRHLEVVEGSLFLKGDDSGNAYSMAIRQLNLGLDSLQVRDSSLQYRRLEIGASLEDLAWSLPDSTHRIQLGKLFFSSEDESLTAEDISLVPQRPDSTGMRFRASLPRLSLKGLRPQEIMQTGKVHLESIIMDVPDVRLQGTRDMQRPDAADLEEDIAHQVLKLAKPYVHEFLAEDISINNARFAQFDTAQFRSRWVEGLSISLKGFRLDSVRRRQLMHAADIRLQAKAYGFRFNEDYELEGRGVWLSTLSRFLQADSLELIPTRAGAAYEVAVPSLIIEGLDANEAWFNRNINVQKIHLAEPYVNIRRSSQAEATNIAKLADRNLYSLIAGKLKGLRVAELELEGGTLRLPLTREGGNPPLRAQNVGLWIKDFNLQPEMAGSRRPFNAEDVRLALDVDQYTFTLPDSSHLVQLRRLRVSTGDAAIVVDSLALLPLVNRPSASQISILAPSLAFYGLNALALIRDGRMEVDTVGMRQPEITVRQTGTTSTEPLSPQRLHAWATRYLRTIGIRKLEMIDSDITLIREGESRPDTFHIPSADFSADNFLMSELLPPEEGDWRFVDGLGLTLRNISRTLPDSLHHLSMDSVVFSTDERLLHAYGTRLAPAADWPEGDAPNQIRASVPRIQMGGVDLFGIIQDKHIALDAIRIISPEVDILKGKDTAFSPSSLGKVDVQKLLPSWLHDLEVTGVQLEGGKVTHRTAAAPWRKPFEVRDIQLQVLGLSLKNNEKAPVKTDDVSLSLAVQDAQFFSKDSSLEVQLGRIGLQKSGRKILIDSVYIRPTRPGKAPFTCFVPRTVFEGVNLRELWRDKRAALSAIHIVGPQVRISGSKPASLSENDIAAWLRGHGLYPLIAPWLDTLQADVFTITQATVSMRPREGLVWNARDVSLSLKNVLVDRFSRLKRYLYAEDMDLRVCDHHFTLPDSLYYVKVGEWRLQTAQDRLEVESLFLEPRLGMYEFSESQGYAIDRADLHVPRLRSLGFDTDALIARQALKMRELQILSPSLELFRNGQLPDSFPPEQATMHQLLRRWPLPLHIDSTYLTNGRIRYLLHEDDADRPGYLSFDDITLNSNGYSNDTLYQQKHPQTVFNGSCKLMDSVSFLVRFRFEHLPPNDPYTITCVMGEAPSLAVFNPMLEPAGFVSIREGSAEKLIFTIEADHDQATGRMRFYYDDLRVKVLSKKKEAFKGFESFLANSFVLRKKNPRARFLRVGKIEYEREKRRSVFRFWARSFLSGIQSSIGLREKEDRIKNLFRFGKGDDDEDEDTGADLEDLD